MKRGDRHELRRSTPIPHTRVAIETGFWAERLRVNREATLPITYRQCRDTGRIDAFRLDWAPGKPNKPHVFWDSDVAKWVEAVSYSLATHPDASLARKLDRVVDLIVRAQQPDGYLNVHFTVVKPDQRWSNLRDAHELYCAGHLMEAAVAHHDATGSRTLLDAMCRYADYIGTVFGRGRGRRRGYPGHEEIELALVRLARATGQRRYLNLAAYFVNERGRRPHFFDREARVRGEQGNPAAREAYAYYQAHAPVRTQTTAEGHAVRACYLYAGMADVARETGDRDLLRACRTVWRNIVNRRLYIHGGIGSTRHGERFTADYDLPNDEAYAETCASIALVFFAHRMLQIDCDGQYADVMERALYNSVLSGVSQDGTRFFYDNVLATQPGLHAFRGRNPPERQAWFGCACCPPNLARLLASFGGYIYTHTTSTLAVHLFVDSDAELTLGRYRVRVRQSTQYPWDGQIRIELHPDRPAMFTLAVRIPAWCRGADAAVNGTPCAVAPRLQRGYLRVRRRWQAGDVLELNLPMPVERMEAHPAARHDCGRVALQRGPVVYCVEEKDNGPHLNDITLPRDAELTVHTPGRGALRGVPLIRGPATRRDPRTWRSALYQATHTPRVPCRLTAIPYHLWAHRGPGEMLVWLRDGGA